MQINIVAVWHNNNICGATWHIQCHHVIEDHRIRGWNYSKYIFCFLLSMFRCICDRARDGRTSGDALAFFAFIHSFIDGEQNSKVSEIFNYILFLDFEWLFFSHFIYTFIYIPIHFITFEQSPWMRYFFFIVYFCLSLRVRCCVVQQPTRLSSRHYIRRACLYVSYTFIYSYVCVWVRIFLHVRACSYSVVFLCMIVYMNFFINIFLLFISHLHLHPSICVAHFLSSFILIIAVSLF